MKPIHSSPLLLEFYKEYYAWASGKAESEKPFLRSWGLCANTRCMSSFRNMEAPHRSIASKSVRKEMMRQFGEAGLNVEYPFCTPEGYDLALLNGTQHTNPARIAWVKARIEDGTKK